MLRQTRFEYYRDSKGKWRGRIRARNGKIIADLSQGYRSKRGIIHAIERLGGLIYYGDIDYSAPVQVFK